MQNPQAEGVGLRAIMTPGAEQQHTQLVSKVRITTADLRLKLGGAD